MLSVLIDPTEAEGGFEKVALLRVANELIALRNGLVKHQRGAGPDRNDQAQMHIIERCLRRNPGERPGSASQVRLVLSEYLPAGESSPSP